MWLDSARGYDVVGDIHGCAATLVRLLEQLGYRRIKGIWQHPTRQMLFLGDIIDRGPQIREALHLVHDMVDRGQAHCIMGNHEFYALAWNTPAPAGSGKLFVREHTKRHARLQAETHAQFVAHPYDWKDFVTWFQHLPLFLDAGRFRLVHALWDQPLIDTLRSSYPDGRIDRAFLQQAAVEGSFADQVFNRLLRGINLRLPHGASQVSSDGYIRSFFRSKFWEEEQEPETYGDLVFQPDALPEAIANEPLPMSYRASLMRYDRLQPILFVGHYWRKGHPTMIRPNVACLDYSAVNGGKLVAYRLDAEDVLQPNKFVWVNAV